MSSINPHYTFRYSQPEEYHFSHDSVFLARRVFELYREKGIDSLTALDLCSGCGIIGLDFIFHCYKELGIAPRCFDFLEVQEIYENHFRQNLKQLPSMQTDIKFILKNYDLIKDDPAFKRKYDLILCNPPYFHSGQGTLSPSEFKNRCRFFLDSDLLGLFQAIEWSLSAGGNAFVLLRPQKDQGLPKGHEIRELISPEFQIEFLPEVRGNSLLRIFPTL